MSDRPNANLSVPVLVLVSVMARSGLSVEKHHLFNVAFVSDRLMGFCLAFRDDDLPFDFVLEEPLLIDNNPGHEVFINKFMPVVSVHGSLIDERKGILEALVSIGCIERWLEVAGDHLK